MISAVGSLAGLRVAIAGAGQGLGAACARAFGAAGARVFLCARTAADVERVAEGLRQAGGEASWAAADLATDEGAEAFAAASFRELGGVDLGLICVGAAHPFRPLREAGRGLLLEQLEQGAVAPMLAAGALLRRWAAEAPRAPTAEGAGRATRAGADRHLLFLSSLVTKRPPIPGTGPYTAAKAALEAFVRGVAEEEWPAVRANALCFGPVRTRLHEQAGTPRAAIETFPAPDEVAPLVLLLAGPRGRGLTGRAIDADALAADPTSALAADGHLASVLPLQPLAAGAHDGCAGAAEDESDAPPEAEPGRRPSVRVRRALRETAASLHRYPDLGGRLAARLERLHGSGPATVALSGGGASELLERSLRALCRPGDEVASPFPTFELLSSLCSRLGLRHRPVPTPQRPDGLFGDHDAQALLRAIGPRTRVVYVASPDNPTGSLLVPAAELSLQRGLPPPVTLLIDEAWAAPPLRPLPNPPAEASEGRERAAPASGTPAGAATLRLRSLSKLHGLAALRIGYAVGRADVIDLLRRLQLPFPLGAPQIACAEAVLEEPERTRRAALLLARRRDRLAGGLRTAGLLVSDGDAPVLLVRDPSGRSAGRLIFALRAAGVAVQEAHWDPAALVIGLGDARQADQILAAIGRALGG